MKRTTEPAKTNVVCPKCKTWIEASVEPIMGRGSMAVDATGKVIALSYWRCPNCRVIFPHPAPLPSAESVADPGLPVATYPDPTPDMLNGDPLFEAIWLAVKGWDFSRHGNGVYSGATGNDARHIYDAIKSLLARA